jgi:hypothetical protein
MILASVRPPAGLLQASIACALGLTMASAPGHSQQPPPCGDWKQITEHLEKEFGEVLVGAGIDGSGSRMLEVYASPEWSFTVLVTIAGGPSCLAATGKGWQSMPGKPKGQPS